MPRLLQVVVFSNDTTISDSISQPTNLTGSLDIPRRMALLRELVADAYNCQAQSLVRPDKRVTINRPLYLFAAPEYLLAKSGTEHLVDQQARDQMLASLKAISKDHPDMIIVPGTIAWKKPQARSAPGKTNVSRTQKAIDRVYNSPLSAKVKSEKLELLLGLSQKIHPNELWFAYNTAYVLHNGEIIHKYSKKNDFTEVNANESNGGRIVFIPGDRSPYFTVDGVDFALEICGEHDDGQRMHDGRLVDVHLIVSATVGAKPQHYVARNGGWVVHADAYGIAITQVNRTMNNGVPTITPNVMTAPATTHTAAQLGGPHLQAMKLGEANLQAAYDWQDVTRHTTTPPPLAIYVAREHAKVNGARARVVRQTLFLP